jgi:hypothetical protein
VFAAVEGLRDTHADQLSALLAAMFDRWGADPDKAFAVASRAGLIKDNDKAGTDFPSDHGTSTSRVAGRSLTSRLPQNPYVNLSIHTALVTLVTSRLRGPTSSARTCGGTVR